MKAAKTDPASQPLPPVVQRPKKGTTLADLLDFDTSVGVLWKPEDSQVRCVACGHRCLDCRAAEAAGVRRRRPVSPSRSTASSPAGRAGRRPGWRTAGSRPPSARRRGGRRGRGGPPGDRTAGAVLDQVAAEHDRLARGDGHQPAHVRSRLVLPAPLGPRTTTTSPGATVRSTPERAGNRPASATAARRWTAGAMAWRPCYGGRGARGQAAPDPSGDRPPAPRDRPQLVVRRWRPRWSRSAWNWVESQPSCPESRSTPKATSTAPATRLTTHSDRRARAHSEVRRGRPPR